MRFYYKHRENNSLLSLKSSIEDENYILITEEEFNQLKAQIQISTPTRDENKVLITRRITELKKLLADTDYQAIKYAESMISEEDYAPIKAQRQAWRDEINQLEAELNSSNNAE